RRHTRSKRDWSSDVCSSDLGQFLLPLWLVTVKYDQFLRPTGGALAPRPQLGLTVQYRTQSLLMRHRQGWQLLRANQPWLLGRFQMAYPGWQKQRYSTSLLAPYRKVES